MNKLLFVAFFFLALPGCISAPPDTFHSRGAAVKNMQTRSFDVENPRQIILSCVSVLQDIGYSIEETNYNLGVVTGTKEADAVVASQVVMSAVTMILSGQITATDDYQIITASIMVNKSEKTDDCYIRAVFAQEIFKTDGFSKSTVIEDQAIYSLFFQKLSKSIFLEANEL